MTDEHTKDPLVEFCRAREAALREERVTREERLEASDAQRTLGNLLRDAMHEQGHTCLTIPTSGQQGVCYARILPPSTRSKPIRTVEDALALVDDVARHVESVSAELLPDAIVRLVRERARIPPLPDAPPRLAVNSRPPKQVNELAETDVSTRTSDLLRQYSDARIEVHAQRAKIAPFRSARQKAERALLPVLHEDACVKVEDRGKERTLRVVKSTRRRGLGMRMLLSLVRESAFEASKSRHTLDATLRNTLESKLRETNRDVECVKVLRSAPATN